MQPIVYRRSFAFCLDDVCFHQRSAIIGNNLAGERELSEFGASGPEGAVVPSARPEQLIGPISESYVRFSDRTPVRVTLNQLHELPCF